MFYFNHWVGWACSVDKTVPEAIHNPVAIKFLVSGLLIWRICACFYTMTGFVFISFWFRSSYLSFSHLIDGCHAWSRLCLFYLEHLVPLPIWIFCICPFWIITYCPYFIIWEVLLAIDRILIFDLTTEELASFYLYKAYKDPILIRYTSAIIHYALHAASVKFVIRRRRSRGRGGNPSRYFN